MFADPRRDRRVDADAGRKAVVGVGARGEGRCNRLLPGLNLKSVVRVAQRDIFAGALEIVVHAIGGGDMRVAVHAKGSGIDWIKPVLEPGRAGAAAVPAHRELAIEVVQIGCRHAAGRRPAVKLTEAAAGVRAEDARTG